MRRLAERPADRTDVEGAAADGTGFFETFYELERTAVFRAMCLIAGSRHEAEDITQEAFVRLWERWDRLGAVEDLRAYLFRVAINEHRMRRRRAAIGRRLRLPGPDVRDELDTVEERHRIGRLLDRLPVRQREALVLTDYLDLPGALAATAMRTTPENVRSLASQARAACRRLLEAEDG